jgi:hypothetical protein
MAPLILAVAAVAAVLGAVMAAVLRAAVAAVLGALMVVMVSLRALLVAAVAAGPVLLVLLEIPVAAVVEEFFPVLRLVEMAQGAKLGVQEVHQVMVVPAVLVAVVIILVVVVRRNPVVAVAAGAHQVEMVVGRPPLVVQAVEKQLTLMVNLLLGQVAIHQEFMGAYRDIFDKKSFFTRKI